MIEEKEEGGLDKGVKSVVFMNFIQNMVIFHLQKYRLSSVKHYLSSGLCGRQTCDGRDALFTRKHRG